MPLFEMTRENLAECKPVTFAHLEIKERANLQHVLRDHIEVLDSDLRVIAEEYGNWEDSRRRIDLLALDKQQRLVVIELKRTETGGHMDLQALRYAAMVSAMTFEQVIDAHEAYLAKRGLPDAGEAAERIREFLELPPDEDAEISSDVRILLVSGDFSREITPPCYGSRGSTAWTSAAFSWWPTRSTVRTISISSRSSHCPKQPITRSRSGRKPSNRRRPEKAARTGPATRSSSTASPGAHCGNAKPC